MRMPARRATFWSASVLTAAVVGLALPVPAASAADNGPMPASGSVTHAFTVKAHDIPSPVSEPVRETLDLIGALSGHGGNPPTTPNH
jgi:hypothetical protein